MSNFWRVSGPFAVNHYAEGRTAEDAVRFVIAEGDLMEDLCDPFWLDEDLVYSVFQVSRDNDKQIGEPIQVKVNRQMTYNLTYKVLS